MQSLKITPEFDFTYQETLSHFGMQISFFLKSSFVDFLWTIIFKPSTAGLCSALLLSLATGENFNVIWKIKEFLTSKTNVC